MTEIINPTAHKNNKTFYFVFGLVGFLLCGVLFCLCIPVFLYRFIITRLIAPYFFRKSLGNVVDPLGTIPSTNFIQPVNSTSKNTILVNLTLEKPIKYDDMCKLTNDQWICAKDPSGKLKYPEFTQYLESWMGFMFWKPEPNFCLKSHIKFHKINNVSAEKCLDQLNEKLLNVPYLEKTSPWDLHLVENCNSTDIRSSDLTSSKYFVILRMHHAMADGFSILHLIVEQLCEASFETVMTSVLAKPKVENAKSKSFSPVRFLQDLGRAGYLIMVQQSIAYMTCNGNEKFRQICKRTRPFSVQKLKQIKNKFGVSFAAVQFAAFAAAITKLSRVKSGNKIITKLPVASALPVPNHEKRLTNQMLGAVYNILVNPDITSYERLQTCHEAVQREHNLEVVTFIYYISSMISCLPVRVVRRLFKNNSMSVIASVLPGPDILLGFCGSNVLAVDYAVGSLPMGNGTITFSSLSYADTLRFLVTAKTAVFSESLMEEMAKLIEDEIEVLNALACDKSK